MEVEYLGWEVGVVGGGGEFGPCRTFPRGEDWGHVGQGPPRSGHLYILSGALDPKDTSSS